MKWWLMLVLMLSAGVLGGAVDGTASPLRVTSTDEFVVLDLDSLGDKGVRVWHTPNPMRVIVDIEGYVSNLPYVVRVSDVALNLVRVAANPVAETTRIVMEFDYRLPPPEWEYRDGTLQIVVSKLFSDRSVQSIGMGVRYGHERRGAAAGPLVINFLEVDFTHPLVELKAVLAQDTIVGRETVSSMASRRQALAAANSVYFAGDGRPLGILAVDGQLVSEPFAARTALGIGPNHMEISAVRLESEILRLDGQRAAVSGINRPRGVDELIVYTPVFGESTNTNVYGLDVAVEDGLVTAVRAGPLPIPADGFVVSGHGSARQFLEPISVGQALHWDIQMDPPWFEQGISHIIGGGPRLVRDGEVYITGEAERFQRDILLGRAPRTALGITDEQKLLIVTVNGRNPGISVGMTLEELAAFMLELGAVDAMNLDGGSSTTMVIRDRVLNIPSDGVERPVSSSLIITRPDSR